jgi:hypothetical protein
MYFCQVGEDFQEAPSRLPIMSHWPKMIHILMPEPITGKRNKMM